MISSKFNWWACLVSFIFGVFVSYWVSQYRYFNVDTTINVFRALTAIITVAIGFYIATEIKNKHNKEQNLCNFLSPKVSNLWYRFTALFHSFDKYSNEKKLINLIKFMEEFYLQAKLLRIIFSRFKLRESELINLTTKIRELEELLDKSNITECDIGGDEYEDYDRIVHYPKDKVNTLVEQIDNSFSQVLRQTI